MDLKRRSAFLALLDTHQQASVEQLGRWLGVSPATVRRDISYLVKCQLIQRTRGGAAQIIAEKPRTLEAMRWVDSLQCQVASKRAIARHAATLCSDGDAIAIGAGTTTYMMADYLGDKRLQILTNSFAMAENLLKCGEHDITIPGGCVYRDQNIIHSPFDADATGYASCTRMFTGIGDIGALGLIETDPFLIKAQLRLLAEADELIVLADSSKFNNAGGLILCGLSRVGRVITDCHVTTEACSMLRRAGVQVDIVDPMSPVSMHH